MGIILKRNLATSPQMSSKIKQAQPMDTLIIWIPKFWRSNQTRRNSIDLYFRTASIEISIVPPIFCIISMSTIQILFLIWNKTGRIAILTHY